MNEPLIVASRSDNIISTLSGLFKWADSAYICSAYANYSAFAILENEINSFLRRGGRLRTIFDIESYITDPQIIYELSTIPGDSECRVYLRSTRNESLCPYGPLHIKLYIFQQKNDIQAIIGSSNFTKGGLKHNLECNILLHGDNKNSTFKEITKEFSSVWDSNCIVRVNDSYELVKAYEENFNSKQRDEKVGKLELEERNIVLSEHFSKAQEELKNDINSEVAYLLGLISGGGKLKNEDVISLEYSKGVFNKNTINEGYICAVDISDIRIKQSTAMKRDVEGIQEYLNSLFKRTISGDKATINKGNNPYRYKIEIKFAKRSKHRKIAMDFIQSCNENQRRIIPHIPNSIIDCNDFKIYASFIRGYADIRGRISPTDRIPNGPLRVALSFTKGSDEFANKIIDILRNKFGLKNVNLLLGKGRQRETLARIDAKEIQSKFKHKFFSVSWKQILLHDFAEYNSKSYGNKYD